MQVVVVLFMFNHSVIIGLLNGRISLIWGGPIVGSFEVILYDTGEIIFNYDYIDYIDPYSGYTCGLNLGEDTRFYNSYQDLTTETEDFSLYFYAMTNDFAPELSLESVIPTSGYQNTLFNFRYNHYLF